MEEIGKILNNRQKQKKERGGVNSARADAVERLMREVMREDPTNSARFKYWLGRTRRLRSGEIHRLIGNAKEGRKPGALFNHLLKNYGKSNKSN